MEPRKVTVGIDPGKLGAIVGIVEDPPPAGPKTGHPDIVVPHAMPTLGSVRPVYDILEIYAIVTGYQEMRPGALKVYIEKQQPLPPKMGGGAANFGRGYCMGLLEGLLVAMAVRYELVSPRRWQRDMLADVAGDNTKVRADVVARRLFPRVELPRSARKRSGIVDALLIAEWGRRQ